MKSLLISWDTGSLPPTLSAYRATPQEPPLSASGHATLLRQDQDEVFAVAKELGITTVRYGLAIAKAENIIARDARVEQIVGGSSNHG